MLDRILSESDVTVNAEPLFQSKVINDRLISGKYNDAALKQSSTCKPKDVSCELVTLDKNRFGPIIGKSLPLRKAFHKMAKTAASRASVIIYGESGTGKELAAKTIHNLSPRRNRRFVPVNCGAIPAELLESEFFGYKKGAFTGAGMDKPGYLDLANGASLFLDEIGELPLTLQVKLLRALDGGGYTPVGSQEVRKPDIRIIAATNRDLRELVRKGRMREDFYYRINVLPIHMPPLRDRKDDLPLLVGHFLQRYSHGPDKLVIPQDVMAQLEAYHWPGNIRELQNVIQRYATLHEVAFFKTHQGETESSEKFPTPQFRIDQDLKSAMEAFEKQYIIRCLNAVNWHKRKTCTILKVNRKTLYKKIQRYGLKKIETERFAKCAKQLNDYFHM